KLSSKSTTLRIKSSIPTFTNTKRIKTSFTISKISKSESTKIKCYCHLRPIRIGIKQRMLNHTESAAANLKGLELQSKVKLPINHIISTIQTTNVVKYFTCSSANKQNTFITYFRIGSLIKASI